MMQFEFLYIHIKSDVYNKNLVCETKSIVGGGVSEWDISHTVVLQTFI